MGLRNFIQTAALLAACVMVPPASVAAPPHGQGHFGTPTRIAPMRGDLLLVSDFSAGAVHVVRRKDLLIVRSIAVDGQPVGLAWAPGRIFVGNETKGQVEAYNAGGKLETTFGAPGSIRLPNSIVVVDAADRLLVLDAFDKTIKVFNLHGTYLGALTAPGVLVNPSAMSFDAGRQLLLVSDFGAFTDNLFAKPKSYVQVIDLGGNKLQSFTLNFSRPQGLAVDGKGRLFVLDSFLAQIHTLDATTGVELGVLGSLGSAADQLDLPLDIAYSAPDARLLVADSRNSRIAVFTAGAQP